MTIQEKAECIIRDIKQEEGANPIRIFKNIASWRDSPIKMMMNVSRRAAFGAEDPNDITNKAQLYINLSTKLKNIVASLWKLVK